MSVKYVKDIILEELGSWEENNQKCMLSIYDNNKKVVADWIEKFSSYEGYEGSRFDNRKVDSVHYDSTNVDIFMK